MRDWAIDYLLHVLEEKGWSMNQLAARADVAASTINRPLRQKGEKHRLSRSTIEKIWRASGIDPAPFEPRQMAEDGPDFVAGGRRRPETLAARVLRQLDRPVPAAPEDRIKVEFVDGRAQIAAIVVSREDLVLLRRKLDGIEVLLET